MTPRRILVLPAHRLWRAWDGTVPANDEDRELSYRILAGRGIAVRRIDLSPRWLNPFRHTLFSAMDLVRSLRVLLFERRADVVFGAFEASVLPILLLRRLFRFRAKVVIADVGAAGWGTRDWVIRLALPRADMVLPYSERQAALLRRDWPGHGGIEAVRANVDCRFYAAAPDCPDGPVLTIGNDYSRDYATFLAAVDGMEHPVLVRSSKVSPRPGLAVMTAPLQLPEYRDLIAQACVVVIPLRPSDNAGGISVLVQAMSSGKPVVVSASPGIAEYTVDGEDALVVPCGDPAAMRRAIDRLLGDPALRERLGQAARRRSLRSTSLEAWADQVENVVRRLVPDKPA